MRVPFTRKEFTMSCNVGGIDRALRIIIGIVLIGLAGNGQDRRVGLHRRGAARYWPDWLVPGLFAIRHQNLQDQVILRIFQEATLLASPFLS